MVQSALRRGGPPTRTGTMHQPDMCQPTPHRTVVLCDYCGHPAELVDSGVIYGRSYGLIWLCRGCNAWVGTHANSPDHAPLGRLANAELREWRKLAHAAFDALWRGRGSGARAAAYRWLARELEMDLDDCHIAMFDVEMCRRVVEVCVRSKGSSEIIAEVRRTTGSTPDVDERSGQRLLFYHL